MAITFEKTPLEWNNAGAEPSTDLKTNGFVAGYKPAADTFNYQINNSSACLTELQTKLSGVDDDVTTLEGTVSELDQNAIRGVRGKGTLITPMSDKTVNITAASVGAAASSHNHTADNITSGTLPIARGGTGGATASAARTNLEVMKAYTLYENSSGTQSTITLSDSSANYEYIEIYFKDNTECYEFSKVYNPNGVAIPLNTIKPSSTCDRVWIKPSVISINGNIITFTVESCQLTIRTSTITIDIAPNIWICKIVGYK